MVNFFSFLFHLKMTLTLIVNPLLETAMLRHLLPNSLLHPEVSPLMALAAVQ
jgi:hypothetical protein